MEAIKSVLEGRNSLIIQPTGSGKSLCFQIPPLVTGKITLVLTPTISLMADQCLKLEHCGIPATFLGSSQMDKDVDVKIKDGCFKVIYVTPEKFFNDSGEPSHLFAHMFACGHIGLVAIDEVHLIRSWESFRYGYRSYIYMYIHIVHQSLFYLILHPLLGLHSSIQFLFVKNVHVQ